LREDFSVTDEELNRSGGTLEGEREETADYSSEREWTTMGLTLRKSLVDYRTIRKDFKLATHLISSSSPSLLLIAREGSSA
jgi:hypothetical protein